MKNQVREFSSEGLVRLHLVAAHHLDPTPTKGLGGRLDRVLRDVGSRDGISVRARMITAVASTKFATLNGLPVSLVGLHGKDELLVTGPRWALEKVANGQYPTGEPTNAQAKAPLAVVQDEITLLQQLPDLLSRVRVPSHIDLEELTAESSEYIDAFGAKRALTALFRTKITRIMSFFETNDLSMFLEAALLEAKQVLHNVTEESGLDDIYRVWWNSWIEGPAGDRDDKLLTATGRHVTAYPISERWDASYLTKPRSNDVVEYLR